MKNQKLRSFLFTVFPALTILILMHTHFWIGLLLVHFTPVIFLVYLLIFLIRYPKLNIKKRLFHGILLLLLAGFIIYANVQFPLRIPDSRSKDGMGLMTWNIEVVNRNNQETVAYINSQTPDIACIQETDAQVARLLVNHFVDYLSYPQSNYFGNTIATKDSMIFKELINLNRESQTLLKSVMRIDGREISIYSVHLPPPLSLSNFSLQKESFAKLSEILATDPNPQIVCGDFNSTMYSDLMRDLINKNGLTKIRPRGFYAKTWKFLMPLLELDHILISADVIDAIRMEYLDFKGSDHRALTLHFDIR